MIVDCTTLTLVANFAASPFLLPNSFATRTLSIVKINILRGYLFENDLIIC